MNRPPSGGRAKRKVGERSEPRENWGEGRLYSLFPNPVPLPPLLSPAFFALSPQESLFTGYDAGCNDDHEDDDDDHDDVDVDDDDVSREFKKLLRLQQRERPLKI